MVLKLNSIYTKELERTKSNIPCLWEEVYIEHYAYNIFVVTDSKGDKIKPLFIKSNDKQNALLPVQIGYYVIYGTCTVGGIINIFIGKIISIDQDNVQYKVISIIKNDKWSNYITELSKAISIIKIAMHDFDMGKPIYIHNTTITMTSKRYIMSIDCESDGLFGKHIAVAMIVYNHNKTIVDSICCAIEKPELTNSWAIENVKIEPTESNSLILVPNYNELIYRAHEFYDLYIKNSMVLTDIPFPVDTSFIQILTNGDIDYSPYPIVDLSSVLISRGYSFNHPRAELYKFFNNGIALEGSQHDPYFDATLTAQLYFKLMDI